MGVGVIDTMNATNNDLIQQRGLITGIADKN
jgi:hypothetical protein